MRRNNLLALFGAVLLCGCANGPTHDYYNPTVVNGPKFKGPITIAQVDDIEAEKQKCLREGYTLIGSTKYSGKYPETVELTAQAKRVHANHIIYVSKFIPAPPGSWHFSLGGWGSSGGSGGGVSDNYIIFLGK